MLDVEKTAPMNAVKGSEIEGSLDVGRDLHIGGEMTVAGDAAFDKDVRIGGWLYAPNIVDFESRVTAIARVLDEAVKQWAAAQDEALKDYSDEQDNALRAWTRTMLDNYDGNLRNWITHEIAGSASGLLSTMDELIKMIDMHATDAFKAAGIKVDYDEANNAVVFRAPGREVTEIVDGVEMTKIVSSPLNFYSTGAVSAYGSSDDEELAGGGTGGLDIPALWDELTSEGEDQIHPSHLEGFVNEVEGLNGVQADISGHKLTIGLGGDVLPTEEQKTNWDTAYNWYKLMTDEEPDADDYINRWVEVVAFLDGIKEEENILESFVTIRTDQTITGIKTFQDKIKIGNGEIVWDEENQCIKFTTGIYSESFVSAYGSNDEEGGGSMLDKDEILAILAEHHYVTEDWLNSQDFLNGLAEGAGISISGDGSTRTIAVKGVPDNDSLSISIAGVKVNTVDNYTSVSTQQPLSAARGKDLNERLKLLEDMFEWSNGNIKAKAGLFSVDFVSAYGMNDADDTVDAGLTEQEVQELIGTSLVGYATTAELASYALKTYVQNYVTYNSTSKTLKVNGTTVELGGGTVKGVSINGTNGTLNSSTGIVSFSNLTAKNPNSLIIGSTTYDGSAQKTVTASDLGVGEGTLTVKVNSSSVGTFSANASQNKTIDISVPTFYWSGNGLYITSA